MEVYLVGVDVQEGQGLLGHLRPPRHGLDGTGEQQYRGDM